MVTLLKDANVYLDKSLFGIATKFKCPDIDMNTITIKTLGGIGEYDLNTSIKALKATLSLSGFDMDVFKKCADPFSSFNMFLFGSLKEFQNETLVDEPPAELELRATSQKLTTLGELEAQENANQEIELNISAMTLTVKGKQLLKIDIPNNIWIVNGVDMLEKTRKNLGLA